MGKKLQKSAKLPYLVDNLRHRVVVLASSVPILLPVSFMLVLFSVALNQKFWPSYLGLPT